MLRDHEDEDVERLATARRLAMGYRTAARRALAFARLYRDEEGAPGGARERACVDQALAWRRAARDVQASRNLGPGLARTRPGEAQPASTRRVS
jgi:hypothetical protein